MIFWNKKISFSTSFCGLKSRCNGKLQQRLPCSQTHPQSGWWETRDSELLNDQIFILIAKENHLCRECSFPKQENLSCFTKQKLYMLPILWFFIRPSPCSALPEFKKSINRGWNEAGRGFEGAAMAGRLRAATNAKDAQELLLMIQRKQSTDGY